MIATIPNGLNSTISSLWCDFVFFHVELIFVVGLV